MRVLVWEKSFSRHPHEQNGQGKVSKIVLVDTTMRTVVRSIRGGAKKRCTQASSDGDYKSVFDFKISADPRWREIAKYSSELSLWKESGFCRQIRNEQNLQVKMLTSTDLCNQQSLASMHKKKIVRRTDRRVCLLRHNFVRETFLKRSHEISGCRSKILYQ